jgi:topoisomerase IV subunit B
VWIRRGGKEYNMSFRGGEKVAAKLEVVGTVGKRNTGTTMRFWPDPKYFDSPKFSVPRCAPAARQGGAVPGPAKSAAPGSERRDRQWHYEGGLGDYLAEALQA